MQERLRLFSVLCTGKHPRRLDMGREGIGKEREHGESARPVRASHPGRLLSFQTFLFGRSVWHAAAPLRGGGGAWPATGCYMR